MVFYSKIIYFYIIGSYIQLFVYSYQLRNLKVRRVFKGKSDFNLFQYGPFKNDNDYEPILNGDNIYSKEKEGIQISSTIYFLVRSVLIGIFTGLAIVIFKRSISFIGLLLFEDLADILPKPVFYWPLSLYPIIGSLFVSMLTYRNHKLKENGIDSIAKTIDEIEENSLPNLVSRILASSFTLGSGCSLGPEGPSVEIGTTISKIISRTNIERINFLGNASFSAHETLTDREEIIVNKSYQLSLEYSSLLERRQLFLAGTSAAVSAGFGAPISGIFFAIECGNRYLSKNAISLLEDDQRGVPRADIAAIVLSATLADIIASIGLEHTESFTLQGNYYAMNSPLFELPLYLGLGIFRCTFDFKKIKLI